MAGNQEKKSRFLVYAGSAFLFLLVLQGGSWLILPKFFPAIPEIDKIQELIPGQTCSNLKPVIHNRFKNFNTGKPDLLVLGDSVSMAHEKQSWPIQTGLRLENLLSLERRLKIEVLARPGWDSTDRLKAWKQYKQLKSKGESPADQSGWPEIVVWQLTLNDILDEVTLALNGQETRITGVCRDKPSLCQKALFGEPVRDVFSWWRRQQAHRQNTISLEKALAESEGLKSTRSALKQFSSEISQTPASGLVLLMPYLYSDPSPFRSVQIKAGDLAEEAGLPYLDLSPVLSDYSAYELRCKLSDFVHPSLKAQQLIAAELAGELSKRNWE